MEPRDTYPAIIEEMIKAEAKFPGWPKDIVHAAAIATEERGELLKAAIDFYYHRCGIKQVKKEALQTGAMIFRFLMHLEEYEQGEEEKLNGSKQEGP